MELELSSHPAASSVKIQGNALSDHDDVSDLPPRTSNRTPSANTLCAKASLEQLLEFSVHLTPEGFVLVH